MLSGVRCATSASLLSAAALALFACKPGENAGSAGSVGGINFNNAPNRNSDPNGMGVDGSIIATPCAPIVNGSFATNDISWAGPQYTYSPGNCQVAGTFDMVTNAQDCHPSWTGGGVNGERFLALNGAITAPSVVWKENVDLVGQLYGWEVYARSPFPLNTPTLEFFVNGVSQGTVAVNYTTWTKNDVLITSPGSGTATLEIHDNTGGDLGNDLMLSLIRLCHPSAL
jgi:hypothetical protein